MTTSSEPKWHGDQTLNATLCDTLVIREGTQPQYYQINVETISATAAALGNEFHREKIRSMEQSKENKPLDWNIDIRTHYERYLKLCHPQSGLFRGATSWDPEETPWSTTHNGRSSTSENTLSTSTANVSRRTPCWCIICHSPQPVGTPRSAT